MPPQRSELLPKEERISLAIASINNNPQQSIRRLAMLFTVPRTTLQTRLQGTTPKHEITRVNRMLTTRASPCLPNTAITGCDPNTDSPHPPRQLHAIRPLFDVLSCFALLFPYPRPCSLPGRTST
jgi:hypothetical protein